MLLSQSRGLKQVLEVVSHFFKVLLLIWHHQTPAYENETSTIFWFIFLLQPYFQGFVRSWEDYLSRAVSVLVYIWRSFPLRADCPKLTALSTGSHAGGTGGGIQIHETEVTASSLSFFAPPPDRPGRACSLLLPELAGYKLPEMTLSGKGSKQKKLVDEKGSVVASGSVHRFWHFLVVLNKL